MPAKTANEESIVTVLMRDIKLPSENAAQMATKMIEMSHAAKEEAEKAPKKPYLTIVSDPKFIIGRNEEMVSWIIQKCIVTDPVNRHAGKEVPDQEVVSCIHECLTRWNETKRGKKSGCIVIADMFDHKSSKSFLKKNGIIILTEEPVFVCITNNHPMGEAILPGGEFSVVN